MDQMNWESKMNHNYGWNGLNEPNELHEQNEPN